MSHTYFISDLHLDAGHRQSFDIFARFLTRQAPSADALYILGDLFEVWIGDDNLNSFNHDVISALKQATNTGLPIYIMHGNRDFFIGKRFMQQTGCQLINDPIVIELYKQQWLLMHGDLLCTQDKPYLKFRKFIRNKLISKSYLSLPLRMRKKLAQRARNLSQQHTQAKATNIMDVDETAVTQTMQHHQVNQLIHGHTHRPNIHQYQNSVRYVLASWHDRGNALVVSDKNPPEMIYFDN